MMVITWSPIMFWADENKVNGGNAQPKLLHVTWIGR